MSASEIRERDVVRYVGHDADKRSQLAAMGALVVQKVGTERARLRPAGKSLAQPVIVPLDELELVSHGVSLDCSGLDDESRKAPPKKRAPRQKARPRPEQKTRKAAATAEEPAPEQAATPALPDGWEPYDPAMLSQAGKRGVWRGRCDEMEAFMASGIPAMARRLEDSKRAQRAATDYRAALRIARRNGCPVDGVTVHSNGAMLVVAREVAQ